MELERLSGARRSLRLILDRSLALSAELDRSVPRLDDIRHRLPSLQSALRPIRAHPDTLASVSPLIDRAVGPAAAVLKVFDAVHGLEPSLLSDPRTTDLSLLKRLEEALRFLSSDNCSLAVHWLHDIVDYLRDNSLADPSFLSSLHCTLHSLNPSPSPSPFPYLDGGLLDAVLVKLETEFHHLLDENTVPLPMPSSSSLNASISPSPLPVPVISRLSAILDHMIANGRLDRCVSAYVDIRSSNVRASLEALDLAYLQISVANFDDAQSIEPYIDRWGRHLEFAVKHLFEAEYQLCCDVFEGAGPPDVWTGCFAEIAAQAGIIAFLRFGKTVTYSKKDPIKLLKLLDIFSSLNKLRFDFNRLFGGQACSEIQNETRDLLKRVIDGSCEIFSELLVQVELQRQTPPPSDGGVPKLVNFVTDYCNQLLGEDYRPILKHVLIIHRTWKREMFQENHLVEDAILNITKALDVNLETWSKGFEDPVLSYLFMMNTSWHFYKHLKGTKLGELLGEPKLREHEQYKEYYSAYYLKESWGKLPSLLSREGLILFSGGGRATARDLVKKRLKAFNETFDAMYQKQSIWVISDKELREKTCQLVIQTIVPVYTSYMQNYGPLVEQDASASKYAKYTARALEKMLGSLFQQKSGRSAPSFRVVRHSNGGKVNGVVTNQYHRSASAVV